MYAAALSGTGTTGGNLKLRSLEELPRSKVREWMGAAAMAARGE